MQQYSQTRWYCCHCFPPLLMGSYRDRFPLQWRHNGRDGVSNHQPHDLLNHKFRRRSKKTSKLRPTGLCAGNSPVTGEFPDQRASNAENISIWWRHHGYFSVIEKYTWELYKNRVSSWCQHRHYWWHWRLWRKSWHDDISGFSVYWYHAVIIIYWIPNL